MKKTITILTLILILYACENENENNMEFVDLRANPVNMYHGYESGIKPVLLQDVNYSKEPIIDFYPGNTGSNEVGNRYRCDIMYKINSIKVYEYIWFYFPEDIDSVYYENEEIEQLYFQMERSDTEDFHRIIEGYVIIYNSMLSPFKKIEYEIYYYYNNDPDIKLKIKGEFNPEYNCEPNYSIRVANNEF